MLKHNKKKNTPTKTAFIGALIILVGAFFILYDYIEAKKVYAYDYMSLYYDGYEIVRVVEEEDINKPIEEKEESGEIPNEYIGYLTIPKINLTKGFHDKRSSENNVDKNILVIEGSNYPDVERGNLIIAGHSGTAWNSFFNELYRLEINDQAIVTYKGKKYTYNIVNIYKQPKTGNIAVYRNYDKTTLTLITCTNYDSTTQTVYIAELASVE